MLSQIAKERVSHIHDSENLKSGIILRYIASRRMPNSLDADYLGRKTSR